MSPSLPAVKNVVAFVMESVVRSTAPGVTTMLVVVPLTIHVLALNHSGRTISTVTLYVPALVSLYSAEWLLSTGLQVNSFLDTPGYTVTFCCAATLAFICASISDCAIASRLVTFTSYLSSVCEWYVVAGLPSLSSGITFSSVCTPAVEFTRPEPCRSDLRGSAFFGFTIASGTHTSSFSDGAQIPCDPRDAVTPYTPAVRSSTRER
mmetsp:Transcript_24198/g.82625  ORF Transcript_24198/g.82625 Transcript_24198/m.82625 type:complete len:207 (-) Transcript_24198:4163-4783(-)